MGSVRIKILTVLVLLTIGTLIFNTVLSCLTGTTLQGVNRRGVRGTGSPGLPIRKCKGLFDNFKTKITNSSAIGVTRTRNKIFERLYFVLGLRIF